MLQDLQHPHLNQQPHSEPLFSVDTSGLDRNCPPPVDTDRSADARRSSKSKIGRSGARIKAARNEVHAQARLKPHQRRCIVARRQWPNGVPPLPEKSKEQAWKRNARAIVRHVDSGNVKQVKKLLSVQLADPNQIDTRKGKMNCPILVLAVGKGEIDMALLLIEQRNINCNLYRSDSTTALIMAASRGQTSIVEKLLAWPGIQVNDTNSNKSTALIVSARAGHVDTVKMLLNSGADACCAQYTGLTALHFASRDGHLEIVQYLINSGSGGFSNIGDRHGFTALMYSCQRDISKVVELLIKHKNTQGNVQNTMGGTALHVAAFHDSYKSMKVLLDSGKLDPMIKDGRGHTALEVAGRRKSSKCEQLLQPDVATVKNSIPQLSDPTISAMSGAEFSQVLSETLKDSGFITERVYFQSAMADCLRNLGNISEMRQRFDYRETSGSYADGLGSNLSRLNGSLSPVSDIDTSVKRKSPLHIEDLCKCQNYSGKRYAMRNGFLQVDHVSGDQPSKSDLAVGVRPAMDFCFFQPCCASPPLHQRATQLLVKLELRMDPKVDFVRSVRPGNSNEDEMRVSCTSLEKAILRKTTTVQGHVYVITKYILKTVITAPGLKSYHSKTLMFFLMNEIPEQDWDSYCLEELVRRALLKFRSFIEQSEGPACMEHFFLPETCVYFKSGVEVDRQRLLECIGEVQENLRAVLHEYLTKHLRPLRQGQLSPFIFHPFLLIELVTPFERPVVPSSGKLESYRHVYSMTFKILEDIGNPKRSRSVEQLTRDIDSLPDYAATTREALRSLLYLKLDNLQAARECLLRAKDIKPKRCVEFQRCSSVQEAGDVLRRQLETSNTAWKFCFYFNSELRCDLRSSQCDVPNFGVYALPGYQLLDFSYFVNFDAMLKTLCLCFIPEHCPNLVSDWYSELLSAEDGDDILELSLFAHFSTSVEQLKHCKRRMTQLSCKLDEEESMIRAVEERLIQLDSQ